MATSNIEAILPYDIKKVWDIVTSFDDYSWRSDLSRIEVLDENSFVEYTKTGYKTIFTITLMETYQRWEFDMENENISGSWVGIFTQKGNETVIDFTENVTAKKVFMKPFLAMYLKKQQKSYIKDLEKALRDRL
ncbi:SRPBCC family protein [Microaceticoccus formicicus]|uniref:SRPBCC family protein n=1 Tax=Microaceticoccus formicicus TaxID=3118105 RepID=UPI003CD027A1|nr:SRPBCC family protein [Peptoniphilaceae bacterium AMB_02]